MIIVPTQVVIPSDILSANTPSVSTTETPAASIHHVDVGLSVSDVTKDSAAIRWRFFTPDEKKYVDGVQIRCESQLFSSQISYVTALLFPVPSNLPYTGACLLQTKHV